MATIDPDRRPPVAAPPSRGKPSLVARFFFAAFDRLAGRRASLHKLHLLEMLAGIPYRAWENRQYLRLDRLAGDEAERDRARRLIAWARYARDNEYRHRLVLEEFIAESGEKKPWYHRSPVIRPLLLSYRLFSWGLARVSTRRALSFNAEFEEHAERVYARFAGEHPEWEKRPAAGPAAREYGSFSGWADLIRRIALDERDHRNHSLYYCGRAPEMDPYEAVRAESPD